MTKLQADFKAGNIDATASRLNLLDITQRKAHSFLTNYDYGRSLSPQIFWDATLAPRYFTPTIQNWKLKESLAEYLNRELKHTSIQTFIF